MDSKNDLEVFDATIPTPAGIMIFAPPMCGKSWWLKELLVNRERIFRESFDYIVYFYGERSQTVSEIAEDLPEIKLVEGLPEDFEKYIRPEGNAFFLFDDLNESVSHSKEMVDLVTKKCQHRSISWAVTLQNAFHHGQERISIMRAAHILVIFDSKLDQTVPRLLANRIMPEKPKTFLEIFKDATREPYSYLLCDGHPKSSNRARLRSNIFGPYQTVYVVDQLLK